MPPPTRSTGASCGSRPNRSGLVVLAGGLTLLDLSFDLGEVGRHVIDEIVEDGLAIFLSQSGDCGIHILLLDFRMLRSLSNLLLGLLRLLFDDLFYQRSLGGQFWEEFTHLTFQSFDQLEHER